MSSGCRDQSVDRLLHDTGTEAEVAQQLSVNQEYEGYNDKTKT